MPFLSLHQNDVKTLKKWMADVDVFLNEEWPALGDSEALEKQLEQCTVRNHASCHYFRVNHCFQLHYILYFLPINDLLCTYK